MEIEKLTNLLIKESLALTPETMDLSIFQGLQQVVEHTGTSKAALAFFYPDLASVKARYQWSADQKNDVFLDTMETPLPLAGPWLMEKLCHNENVVVSRRDHLPPEGVKERRLRDWDKYRSVVVLPLFIDGKLGGYLELLTNNSRVKRWTPVQFRALRGWGEFLLNMLMRQWLAEDLQHLRSRQERLIAEKSADLISENTRLRMALSEHDRIDEKLVQTQKMETIGRLAGGIAHDFNNLLTAIIGYSELALQHLSDRPQVRSMIDEIRTVGKRGSELVRQLLVFSRQQAFRPVVLDINGLLREIDKMLRRLVRENIDLKILLASDLGKVKVDSIQMEQVIINLVVNACDAMTGAGKIVIETANVYFDETSTHFYPGARIGDYVMLSVSDTGAGMDKETQSHIFEPFFTTKDKDKGTGLGLSTVYGIIKRSGGHVTFYTEVGRGTTFKVYLPRVYEEATAITGEEVSGTQELGTGTILLVEDEDRVRILIKTMLVANGYTVLDAADSETAMAIYDKNKGNICLVIADLVMPRMSGRELVEHLKVDCPDLKVLYISGYTEQIIVSCNLMSPEIPFLQKPFSSAKLLGKVREILTRKD